jgi:hypothetical protein
MALRWARALSLLFSWLWLICGISALLFMALLMPDMFAQMNKSGQLPPETIAIMKAVMFAFMSVIYLVLPGVFGFFYQSRHVKATCEARDAKERWTDRCPLPVLALSLVFGFWTASMVLMGFYNWALPFFGTILSGPAGAAVTILLMALMGYVSWGTWRLRIAAWWCAVLSSLIWVASSIVTFARVDLMQLYEKMNFAADQLDLIKQTGLPQNQSMTWFISAWFLGFLAYLLYTKKYFQGEPQNTRKSTEEA